MNDLSDQTVMVFDDSAARGSAIPTPSEGMVTYLKDEDKLFQYDGSNFVAVSQPGILQVVSTTKTDTFSTTSGTYTDITDLSLSITPTSATSKVLVIVAVAFTPTVDNTGAHVQLLRDSTALSIGDAAGSRVRASATVVHQNTSPSTSGPTSIVFLDSPASASSLTYKLQTRRGTGGTVVINSSRNDADEARTGRLASSITLMEVAG
jgi:hypothetical protein